MNEKLLAILMSWRAGLLARAYPTPDEQDLRTIASSDRRWPAGQVGPVAEAYRDTIQYLELQDRMGVRDPIPHMADEMWAPPTMVGPPPGRPDAPGPSSALIDTAQPDAAMALRDWVAAKNAAIPGSVNLPEPRLRQLAASTPTNRLQMVRSFNLLAFADEIDAVIMSAAAAAGPPARETPRTAEPTGPVPTKPPTAASPSVAAALPTSAATLDVDPHGFAAYGFGPDDAEPLRLVVAATAGKSLMLSWDAPDDSADVHVYRVVAGDDEEPWSPESGRLVAATTALEVEDTDDFVGAVRFLQVWCNSGKTVQDAKRAQPRCIATRAVVSPVRDVRLREEAGTVTGEWDVFDAIERVLVFRVPRDKVRQGSLSPLNQIEVDENNLGGFHDGGAERGRHYLYQIVAETTVKGVRVTSAPVVREQQISIILERVRDLEITVYEDAGESYFDVTWTPPGAGRVAIFRSQQRPAAGIEDEAHVEEAALEGALLYESDRLAPVRRGIAPGKDGMRRVPWPASWSRAYFTPVTVLNGRAVVGVSQATTRVSPVRDPDLVERVNEQLLTFAWPPGAAAVWLYQTPRGVESHLLDPTTTRANHEISREMWMAQGGYHLSPPLPVNGCRVHLFATAYQQAQTFFSVPVAVDYPGLRVLRYDLTKPARRRIDFSNRAARLTLSVTLLSPGAMPPVSFALIANQQRLPLDPSDGIAVAVVRADLDGAPQETVITPGWLEDRADTEWTVQLDALPVPTFVRLFPLLRPDDSPDLIRRIALLDPPVSALMVGRS